jgi:ADP-ribose pyrophosphatase YjhB (NUDIX family)
VSEWLDWVKQIKAISQIGRAYSKDAYDLERYDQLTKIAHAMFARLADVPVSRIDDLFVPERGYATPKVDLRAGVFCEDKVLLVKERTDGRWSLPGGWADVCESPRQGMEREVFEETGYAVRVIQLVAVRDHALHGYQSKHAFHIYKMFFLCEFVGGDPIPGFDIEETGFFSTDALPPLSLGRILPEDIAYLYARRTGNGIDIYCD